MTDQKEQGINDVFFELISEEYSEDEFWAWVRDWLDVEGILQQADEWDAEVKLDDIRFALEHTKRKEAWKEKARKLLKSNEHQIEGEAKQ